MREVEQLGLTFDPPMPMPPREPTLRERAEQWLLDNPGLYAEIVRRARKVKAAGNRVGIKAIFESIRWDQNIRTVGDEWKVNNSFAAPVARIVMEREGDLVGFFETRGDEPCTP